MCFGLLDGCLSRESERRNLIGLPLVRNTHGSKGIRVFQSNKMDRYRKLSVHFDPGGRNNRCIAIFQCPGKKEEQAKHPAAGATGKNLSRLFDLLRHDMDYALSADFIYDPNKPMQGIAIGNAYPRAYYKNSKNGTRPHGVIPREHVVAMAKTIEDKKVVFCFGKRASKLYQMICKSTSHLALEEGCRQVVVHCCHLGYMSINQIKLYSGERGPAATHRRLQIIKNYIISVFDGSAKTFSEYLNSECSISGGAIKH